MKKSSKMTWDRLLSSRTTDEESTVKQPFEQRTQFTRDYDRLSFSGPFHRLQNKTQVFPLPGAIFVHNRLTHSLEVSCVGRSLGNDVAQSLIERNPEIQQSLLSSIGSIVSAACLAHDLGNPPFGHKGEEAISSYFINGAGQRFKTRLSPTQWNDITHFDGNANTFRLLTNHFRGRMNHNFGLTYSTLASIVKYPYSSDLSHSASKFGFFQSEENNYREIAEELGIIQISVSPLHYVRHPLVYLVEAADDICYQIMDIEDAFKLKILTQEEVEKLFLSFFTEDFVKDYRSRIEQSGVTDVNSCIAYLRGEVINLLEHACAQSFLQNEDTILSGEFDKSLVTSLDPVLVKAYKECAQVAKNKIYKYRDSVDVSLAGCKIITELLDAFLLAADTPGQAYSSLLLEKVPFQYAIDSPTLYGRILAVLDYLSAMTDIFAVDLHQTISGRKL